MLGLRDLDPDIMIYRRMRKSDDIIFSFFFPLCASLPFGDVMAKSTNDNQKSDKFKGLSRYRLLVSSKIRKNNAHIVPEINILV